MAKLGGPLLSEMASGSVADFLTFSKRKTGQQVRWQKKQKDVLTILRFTQRNKFLNASLACRFMEYGVAIYGVSLYGNEKDIYELAAKNKDLTGYNLCIKEYLND